METRQQEQSAEVSIRRNYPVAPDKVWRAWTEPQALRQWFGPGATPSRAEAEIDLRVGGRYRIAIPMPDGDKNEASGEYLEVVPNRRLVFTWAWKGTPERVSRVTIDLRPVAGGTDLSFVHDRFFDDKARANHERGWQPIFGNLEKFLGSQP